MLKNIHLTNFESHKDSFIEFSPGITVFVGSTNAGKSSILRAIRWVSDNDPLGDEIINDEEDEAVVSTEWGLKGSKDSIFIKRLRNGSDNEYHLTGYDTFTAFGASPPEQVLDIINFSEVNVQPQFSPYFLVFETPGSIAKFIKSVTGLSDIDKVSENIASKIRSVNATIKAEKESLENLDSKLKILEIIPLDDLKVFLNSAEGLIFGLVPKRSVQKKLSEFVDQIISLEDSKIDIPKEVLDELKTSFKSILNRYSKNSKDFREMKNYLDSWVDLNNQKQDIKKSVVEKIKNELSSLTISWNQKVIKQNSLVQLIRELEKFQDSEIELLKNFDPLQLNELANNFQEKSDKLLSLFNLIDSIETEEKAI